MPIQPKENRPPLCLSLIGLAVMLSSCQLRSYEDNWIHSTGTVKDVENMSLQGASDSTRAKPLYSKVTFQYLVAKRSYTGTQLVSINVPMHFESGQTIPLIINKEKPFQASIELPSEPQPDRTGMRYRIPPATLQSAPTEHITPSGMPNQSPNGSAEE